MTSLKNKVALITGSGRGIGKAIAERYASLGADVVVNYMNDQAAAEITLSNVKKYGVKAMVIQADISKVTDVQRMYSEALKIFGKVDIVVANAGIEIVDLPVVDVTEEQFDRVFAINAKGSFFTMQEATKHIADNGRIIYVSSSTTAIARAGAALYASSKTAPMYMVGVLAKELGKKGITVNTIIPTAIEGAGIYTDPNNRLEFKNQIKQSHAMGRIGTVEDVANVAEFFASDLSSFVSGQSLLVTGGEAQ